MTAGVGYHDVNLPDHRIRTMAVMASFWAWCGLLSFPMIGMVQDLTDDYVYGSNVFGPSGTILKCQIAGLALFLTAMCLTHSTRIVAAMGRLGRPQLAILVIFYLSLALQLHDGETAALMGILYTCLLLFAALTLSVLWTALAPDDLETCLNVAAVILCLFGISALVILGLPTRRNVGDIQPNLFAGPLLVGFIFSQFRAGTLGIAVRAMCFSMIALVSSRFAVIGCILALAVHELTFKPASWRKLLLPALALTAVLVFWPQIAALMALDDPDRGLFSGFTGRDDRWQTALAGITEHPFGIGFKRAISADESGHNGYLKILLEFGVPGGGLMILFIACAVVLAGIEAVTAPVKGGQRHRFDCARFAGLVALVFGAFFQPQLLNLGDTVGISLLFLLFRPKSAPISDPSLALRPPGRQADRFFPLRKVPQRADFTPQLKSPDA